MILNLGCGVKTSNHDDVVNMDWSIYLRIKKNAISNLMSPLFIKGQRLERLRSLPDNIVLHDLRKGIPFEDNSIDLVYHSHFFEHINRSDIGDFLLEVKRVLKPSGIQRIVVPDFEWLCRSYLNHLELCFENKMEIKKHDNYIAEIIEQMVRKDSHGSSTQTKIKKKN